MLARTEGVLRNPHPEEFLWGVAQAFDIIRAPLMTAWIILVMFLMALIAASPILIFTYKLVRGEISFWLVLVTIAMLWTIIQRQKRVRRALNSELAYYAPALTRPVPVQICW